MSWMRGLRPTLDERGVRVRNVYRHPNLLCCKFGQARKDFHSVEIFIQPFRKLRWIPPSQCFNLFRVGSGSASFSYRAMSRDAS